MTEDQVEALILGEIKRRRITWLDMIGGRGISYEANHERVCRINRFKAESWSDRLIELVSDGNYDPYAKHHATLLTIQDLMRFWWNRCICQEDMMDEILEDIFVYFKDKLNPDPYKEPDVRYDLDFSQVIQEQCRLVSNVRESIAYGRCSVKQVLVTLSGGIIDQVLFFDNENEAVTALEQYVKAMDVERDDAGVYGPNGLLANAKDYLDE